MTRRKMIKYLLLFSVLVSMLLTGCGAAEPEVTEALPPILPQESEIGEICELSTLDIYLHNVAKAKKKLNLLVTETESEVWVEFYGNVKVGIKGNEVEMKVDAESGEVVVTMPEPVVLSVRVDEKTLTEDSFYIGDKGLFKPDITPEDIAEALGDSEQEMKQEVENDAAVMNQAKKKAEDTIEKYIENMNMVMGTDYRVTFQYKNASGFSTDGSENQ